MVLVSIIVPVYNVEKYLEKCILSIVGQTYREIDILLVDDGSTDDSGDLCDAWAKKDSRITVIHKRNGGLSSARNAGLDIAAGKYIVFVDSDDYIHPQMIEKLYKAIRKDRADIAVCGLQYRDENDRALSDYPTDIIQPGIFDREEIFDKIFGPYGYYYAIACSKLYRAGLWDAYRFPEGKIHEDEFACHHILGQCRRITCIGNIYYYYVQRNGSIMSGQSVGGYLDALEAFLDRMVYFKEHKMTQFIFRQDQCCFSYLWNIRDMQLRDREIGRYRLYQEEYHRLHKWALKNIRYPFMQRIKIALYQYFPSAILRARGCYRKLKKFAMWDVQKAPGKSLK